MNAKLYHKRKHGGSEQGYLSAEKNLHLLNFIVINTDIFREKNQFQTGI
jgi:hypothetical protein